MIASSPGLGELATIGALALWISGSHRIFKLLAVSPSVSEPPGSYRLLLALPGSPALRLSVAPWKNGWPTEKLLAPRTRWPSLKATLSLVPHNEGLILKPPRRGHRHPSVRGVQQPRISP